MKLFSRKDIDMLQGPILSKVFLFALPLMATNLLQMFYNAADMIVVGLSNVSGAIGAIGTTNSFCALLVNLFSGFSVGAGVVIARNIGARDRKATHDSVHTSILVAMISGFIVMTIGLIASRPILTFMGDEGHILDLAMIYTRIYFIGIPFLALTNFETSILRAKGDTVTPLIVLSVSGVLNVFLNLFFVIVLHMSVDGVALATAIANVFSAGILFVKLSKDSEWVKVELKELTITRTALKSIIRDGIPAAIQGMLFSISNMMIQSTVTGINNAVCPGGSDVIDGRAAAASIEGFLYVSCNSVAQAAVTFAGQNYGAKQFRRIGRVMRDCYFVSCLVARVGCSVILLFSLPLVKLYVSAPLAIEIARKGLFINLIFYESLACMDIGSSILRGMGKSFLSTVISLMGSCAMRILWILFVFPFFRTFEAVIISYPISWVLTSIASFTACMIVRKNLMKQEPEHVPAIS